MNGPTVIPGAGRRDPSGAAQGQGLRRHRVSLSQVEHLADAGLLAGSGDHHAVRRTGAPISFAGVGHGGEDIDTPSLDPRSQEAGCE